MKKLKFSWGWFEIGLIVLSLLAHLYIASRPANSLMNWYSSDDGFYYFKVAANINSGLGVTFDGINPTNGFQPLWMLVCIPVFALARFDLILPLRVLVMVSALLNAGTGILLFRLLRRLISSWTAAVVAMVWVFLPSIHAVVVQNGMESAISAFFLALLLTLVVQQREELLSFWKLVPIGVVGGLAILARLDNIFVVMLIGLWFVLGQTSRYLRMILVGDFALVYIVGLLGYYVRLPAGPLYIANSASLPWHVALGFILIPSFLFIFGLYPSSPEKISWKFLLRCALAVGLASGITGICLLILQRVGLISALPRSVILINFAGTLVCVVGLRWLAGNIYRPDVAAREFLHPFPLFLENDFTARVCLFSSCSDPVGILYVLELLFCWHSHAGQRPDQALVGGPAQYGVWLGPPFPCRCSWHFRRCCMGSGHFPACLF